MGGEDEYQQLGGSNNPGYNTGGQGSGGGNGHSNDYVGFDTPVPFSKTTRGRTILSVAVTCALAAVVGVTLWAVLGRGGGSGRTAGDPKGINEYRLPSDIIPVSYGLDLVVTPGANLFGGTVEIEVTLADGVDYAESVTVNAGSYMSFDMVSVDGFEVDDWAHDEVLTTLTFDVPDGAGISSSSAVPEGAGRPTSKVRIRYTAYLSDKFSSGFYVASKAGSAEGFVAVTDFEATRAREAFPCFDEPAYKATFQLTLKVPEDLSAVCGAGAAEASVPDDGLRVLRFPESVKMSTYLFSWAVFDPLKYEPLLSVSTGENPVLLAAWAPSDRILEAGFAVQVASRAIEWLQVYFGIPFPLKKIDLFSVPNFQAGAMENWGLITFTESSLLANATTASPRQLQDIAATVVHELVHQWFGNLVTPAWWNSLWLNEAFATFLTDAPLRVLFPEWDIDGQFIVENVATAFEADGFADSHPIEEDVQSPAEIESIFDAVSYEKGAAVLRMLSKTIGADTFRRGVQMYLTANAYGSANATDFFAALSLAQQEQVRERKREGGPSRGSTGEGEKVDVTLLLDAFVNRKGYPAVTVTTAIAEDGGDGIGVALAHSKFGYSGPTPVEDGGWFLALPWYGNLPDAGGKDSAPAAQVSLTAPNGTFNVHGTYLAPPGTGSGLLKPLTGHYRLCKPDGPPGNGAVVVNSGHPAYVLTLYDSVLSRCVAPLMDPGLGNETALQPQDRAGRILDLNTAALRGSWEGPFTKVKVTDALDAMRFLRREDDYAVWAISLGFLGRYAAIISASDREGDGWMSRMTRAWCASAVEAVSAKLGWERQGGESHTDGLLRAGVQRFAAEVAREPSAVDAARALFAAFARDPVANRVPEAVRATVFRVGVTEGVAGGFDTLRDYLLAGSSPGAARPLSALEREDCIYGLAGSTVPVQIKELLSWAIGGRGAGAANATNPVRDQEVPYTLRAVSRGSAEGYRHAIGALASNYTEMFARASAEGIVESVASGCVTGDGFVSLTHTVDRIMPGPENGGGKRPLGVGRALELAEANSIWSQNSAREAATWFSNHAYDGEDRSRAVVRSRRGGARANSATSGFHGPEARGGLGRRGRRDRRAVEVIELGATSEEEKRIHDTTVEADKSDGISPASRRHVTPSEHR